MEIKIPEVGESVVEALVAKWHKQDGERVVKDEPVCEIETDKITLEINAAVDGILSIKAAVGETVKIGTVIGLIAEAVPLPEEATSAPSAAGEDAVETMPLLSPAVRKMALEKGVSPEKIQGSGRGGRVILDDLFRRVRGGDQGSGSGDQVTAAAALSGKPEPPQVVRSEEPTEYVAHADERITRQRMTPIRKRIAERLLAVRQQTAMLTTFNEADMGRLIALRQNHKEHFLLRHGVSLGFMSFFIKACVDALKEFPLVNARIDGEDIVHQHFYDIGIAIGAEKGLVVPIIRDADQRSLAELEKSIKVFVERIHNNQLNLSDISGGTFTISNGGVYGSLLSTPILNPPQSAVLGMHAIQERPVALNGKVVIRPMMYLALSYDHRLVDGREAVGFLKKIKEYVEDPEELLLEG